jgi:SAM-dependent methyltransferase
VNEGHRIHLASPAWRAYLETELLPWVLGDLEIGGVVLEVGPGPGLTTELLSSRAEEVVAVEVDAEMAGSLAARLAGTNVDVVCGDAASTDLATDRFDLAFCLSMLHHVPSPAQQDDLLREVCRVLRPGGVFLGSDSTDHPGLRTFHSDDVFVPVDPATFPSRLRAAGFGTVDVEVADGEPFPRLRFRATTPG